MLSKKSLILITLCCSVATNSYAQFLEKEVTYTCRVAPYYTATSKTDCMSEQKTLYNTFTKMLLSSKQKKNSYKWGSRLNAYGDVVGVDYYNVLQRAKYLKRTGELK